MELDQLKDVTATCGSGEAPNKVWHKILAGRLGTYGVELNINVSELERAIKAGARTWVNKNSDKMLTLKPKYWGKDAPVTPTPHGTAKADGYAPEQQDLGDAIPF